MAMPLPSSFAATADRCISNTFISTFCLVPVSSIFRRKRPAKRMARQRNEDAYSEALSIIKRAGTALPGLVVLDLDYTIWPYWCEVYGPEDTAEAALFPECREIIEACKDSKIALAVASRSPSKSTAIAFLSKLGLLDNYFEETIIIPYEGKDQVHFPKLHRNLGINYDQMLFFDDESENIRRVTKLGVTSILVSMDDGFCLNCFRKGLQLYSHDRKR